MKNITLALDEKTIKASREYARRHNLSLNSLVRKLLQQTIAHDSRDWIDECFSLMDTAEAGSIQKTWKREDLYRV